MFPEDYVLVVDDDDGMRETVVEILVDAGIVAYGVGTGNAAVRAAEERTPLVAVVDHRLPDMTGIEVVGELKRGDPDLPVVLITGFSTLETAINAVGVVDEYLTKPVRPDRIVTSVKSRLERRRLQAENGALLDRLERTNARLEGLLAERSAELEGVLDVAAAGVAAGEADAVLEESLLAVARAAGTSTLALYAVTGGEAAMTLRTAVGDWSPPRTLDAPPGEITQDALGSPPRWATTVAISAGGVVIGALVMADERRGTPRLLRTYAALLAGPLRTAVPLTIPAARPAGDDDQTRRSTATTRPSTVAPSPGMGS
jgi:FixJ family two-component response regulator